ncbi:MAG: T9SS type A sorting domain-containing protein [Methanococcaceae archaeon]
MRKNLLVLLVVLVSLMSYAQTNVKMIESFDNVIGDSSIFAIQENLSSSSELTQVSDKVEGTSALQMKVVIGSIHDWGSYVQLLKRVGDNNPTMDWAISDTISLWIKVVQAPSVPTQMVFRIHLGDRLEPGGAREEYAYENATVIDAATEWINLKVPLFERTTDGETVPNNEGFVRIPGGWGGGVKNDGKLNFDKIDGWNLAIVSTSIAADSCTLIFDKFERTGIKSVPAVFFNGMVVASALGAAWTWGQSSFEVVKGAGQIPGTNAMKWTQGDEWGGGWTGFGWNITPALNLAGSWPQDSLHFNMKCDEGVGELRWQFESPGAKSGHLFTPIADGQWHTYDLALKDFVFTDNAPLADSSNITVLGLMAQASGKVGKVVWVTDLWTGHPLFDVLPPVAPTALNVIQQNFSNLVSWTNVPGEAGETYTVYYSPSPITDVKAPRVEVVKSKIAETEQIFEHLLRVPLTNKDVTYYYAVTCTDAAGNEGAPVVTGSPITNTAKGVVTVSLTVPTNFTADGDLSEWSAVPFTSIKKSDGSGFVAPNTTITDDADLSAKAYVAVDNQYLYVAFDMEDDIVSHSQTTSYLNDGADIFIGLYNWHGAPHTNLQRGGAEPDYHLRFAFDRIIDDAFSADSIDIPGANYFWGPKFPSGWVVEARIELSHLAANRGDQVFVPVEGYRLPIDFEFNDADATGSREGILCYSVYNEDKSYQTPERWSYTWVGSLMNPTGVNDNGTIAKSYNLLQNYPNPFNPSTTINYTLEKPGMVTLRVYDVLGRLVSTLVNQSQSAGSHSVNFNASNLSSGIYFYKIDAGSFQSIRKMMLIK